MSKEKNILRIERTAIILLWIVVFISPLLFVDEFNDNWHAVYVLWVELFIIAIAFMIHRFLLLPRLFFKKKYIRYILSIGVVIFIIGVFILSFDGVNYIISLFSEEFVIPTISHGGMSLHGGIPPHGGSVGMPPPHGAMPHTMPPVTTIIPPSVSVLTLLIIVLLLDLGLSIATKWLITEQREAEKKRERVTAQLSNLQNQVSPHFFMNTLNNIHALIEIDPPRAQETIIELSELMGYLLYESSNMERVSLQREIEFITSYINLMRLRFPKRVTIDFKYDNDVPQIKIPPLLFLNFIENSFKYGIDYSKESFIKIAFRFTNNEIKMTAENSNHSATVKSDRHGLGISNTRKRLKLLYENNFTLNIINSENVYFVTLKIPII